MSANHIPTTFRLATDDYETYQDDITSVMAGMETDIISINVPSGQTFLCFGGSASGRADATYRFYVDGVLKETRENAWTSRDVEFVTTKKIEALINVKITVEHRGSTSHDFSGTIVGLFT